MKLTRQQMKIAVLVERLDELARLTAEPGNLRITLPVEKVPNQNYEVHVSATQMECISVHLLEKHRASVVPGPKVIGKIDAFVEAVFGRGRHGISSPVHDPSGAISTYDFAELIGISRSRARYIVDHTHASFLPTYSAVTQEKEASKKFVRKFGGLYTLYRHDRNAITQALGYSLGVLVRCALSIRYPLPYKPRESEKNGRSRIRCRLTIPNYNRAIDGKYHYYDGYVGIANRKWLQFLFQRRPGDANEVWMEDLILMYTGVSSTKGKVELVSWSGVMLTQNQDHGSRFMPSASSVVVLRDTAYSVTENLGAKTEWLEAPFDLVPDREREFVQETVGIVDLTAADQWNPQDRAAVTALHKSRQSANIYGLHV